MANVNANGYTVVFAAVSCIICSVLLSGANVSLKDMQDKNKTVDKQRNVLMAAQLADATTPPDTISSWFAKDENGNSDIKAIIIDNESGTEDKEIDLKAFEKKPANFPGKSLIYECTKEGQEVIILPIDGVGLWGKMLGFLAVKPNGNDVVGISFYYHIETPGLGAEITEPWFTSQYPGKKLLTTPGDFSDESYRGIEVKKGIKVVDLPEADQPYSVDGISGATITSNGVTDITKKYVKEKYISYLKNRNK